MITFLRLLLIVGVVASAATEITGINATHAVKHESTNVLHRREEQRIVIRYCSEVEEDLVEYHLGNAFNITNKARRKLSELYDSWLYKSTLPPPKGKYPDKLRSIYWTYAMLMNPKMDKPPNEHLENLDRKGFERVKDIMRGLEIAFKDEGPRAAIYCSDNWINTRDDFGNHAPEPGFFWDNRPVKEKINGGWFEVKGGKFSKNSASSITVTQGVPGSIPTIFTLNQNKFKSWYEHDISWKDYTVFRKSSEWVENPETRKFEQQPIKQVPGMVSLEEMGRNDLSSTLIGAFAQTQEMMPRDLTTALSTPEPASEDEIIRLQTPWNFITNLAREDPNDAQWSSWNFMYLCIALYLDNWDWTSGENRHFRDVYTEHPFRAPPKRKTNSWRND